MNKQKNQTESKYARKRGSGKMMYGPTPKIAKYPDYRAKHVHGDQFWWGEPRRSAS